MFACPVPTVGRAGSVTPVVASYSQSSNYGGTGVAAASLANMSDGLAEPFAATNNAAGQYVRATLAAAALVARVTIGASTGTNGWGAELLNGAKLQRSNDGGASWTDVVTLSGFVTSASAAALNIQIIQVAAVCTDLRVVREASGYLALSEFTVAGYSDTAEPSKWNAADKSTGIGLSNGDATETTPAGGSVHSFVRSITSHDGGTFYGEVTIDSLIGTSGYREAYFGVCSGASPLNDIAGKYLYGVSGLICRPGEGAVSVASSGVGAVIGVRIIPGTSVAFFRNGTLVHSGSLPAGAYHLAAGGFEPTTLSLNPTPLFLPAGATAFS